MDSNGTHFHLLLGRSDWVRTLLEDGSTPLGSILDASPPSSEEVARSAAWIDAHTQELALRPRLARFLPSEGDQTVELARRRGAGRDRYGNWYWVSDDRASILVRSAGSDETTVFWPPPRAATAPAYAPGDFAPMDAAPLPGPCLFGGLVLTADHHLVAISTLDAPPELLIFDLFSGGPPTRSRWPAGVALEPWDLAPREPGGFWLLDRRWRRLWEFNTHFQVVRSPWVVLAEPELHDFVALPEAESTSSPPAGQELDARACSVARVTDAHALPLLELDPIAVEPLPGGGALVLDGHESSRCVGAYRAFSRRGQATLDAILDVIDRDPSDGWRLVPHDFAVVRQPSPDLWLDSGLRPPLLFVADHLGNQAFCFELEISPDGAPWLRATAQFLPMRLFGGRVLLSADGRVYYDGLGRFVPLVAQERPRFETDAIVLTPPLDGDAPGCVWHRVLFEACIPSDTGVRISTRATDAEGAELSSPEGRQQVLEALDGLPWDEEPPPVARASGCELPWLRAEARGEQETWELLLQRAQGRYLQLRIALEGDGRHSPRVRALRLYFPRFSYVSHYLPACYRDDAVSASFLERFLANHEGLLTALEDRALALGVLCDPAAAPAEFLDWLARWYAVYLDPAWPPARKRLFLRHALTFFQWRGTARGLRAALRLAFDDCIDDSIFSEAGDRSAAARRFRITEDFRARTLPAAAGARRPCCPGVEATPGGSSPVWTPGKGLEALQRLWRESNPGAGGAYPLEPPAADGPRASWQSFSQTTLGFVPVRSTADRASWQGFLRCRHASFEAARSVWAGSFDEEWASFADVELPTLLPAHTLGLDDWVVFQRWVRPMRAAAHRFGVSLPVQPQRARDAELLRVQLHLADRLIALEKPAHTAYRVQLHWEMFRVGEVQLGTQTPLGQGSRLTELPPLVLGEGALAEGRLASRPDDWARGRLQLARNALSATPERASSSGWQRGRPRGPVPSNLQPR